MVLFPRVLTNSEENKSLETFWKGSSPLGPRGYFFDKSSYWFVGKLMFTWEDETKGKKIRH